MTGAYESIRQGLTEAIAYAEGKESGARVHQVEVPEVNVAAIRASTGAGAAGDDRETAEPGG